MPMNLVFRLGEIGFAVPIGNLIEIREGSQEWMEPPDADSGGNIFGNLLYRGRTVPVFDFRKLFDLPDSGNFDSLSILVFGDIDMPWGLAVERVEGIFPGNEFVVNELPLLLRNEGQDYDTLDIWRNEPLVHIDVKKIADRRIVP